MEVGPEATHQGAIVVTGAFIWGYGSGSKGVAFWGWIEDSAGGWAEISKLVMERGSGVCAVANRPPQSITGPISITAVVMGAYRGPQRVLVSGGMTAWISDAHGAPRSLRVEGSMKKTGRVTRDAVHGRSIVARPCTAASIVVDHAKARQ